MTASPQFFVSDNHDRCPICKSDSKTCPHSLSDMAERLWENWVRKVVRDELRRQTQSG